MNTRRTVLRISFTLLGAIAPSAFAQAIPTMNQPDNGFYEGADPEWATLHSTDARGTTEHRQYHRDAVQAHILWHAEHRSEQGTAAYENTHRINHQERNANHRAFHTFPELLNDATPSSSPIGQANPPRDNNADTTGSAVYTNTNPPPNPSYGIKPSRRSIIAAAEEQNRMRAVRQ